MPLPLITDTLRVGIEGTTGAGRNWANVLHFRKTSALTYVGAMALLDPILVAHMTVNSGAGQSWKTLAATVYSLTQFRYTPLDGASASTVIGHSSAGLAGSVPLPANVALVVSLHTALRGRSYRGRVYQAGSHEGAAAANGTVSPAVVTAVLAQWQGLLTALSGSGLSLVVASYTHSTAENVTGIAVNTRWDSQRRRLGR